ncbi:MAG: hypothetical protein GEU98_26545 [Pseudonocardiaceae bacterium]|nr:hypothetical protein [Pseudonocardiaceae bacterium]
MEQILDVVRGFDGVLELAPTEGSEFPEIAWGDHFFYYAPNGQVPQREQPYATIVTKNYPGDTRSDLDPPGRWRLNIHVGKDTFTKIIREDPRSAGTPKDLSEADVVFPHPVYGRQGWVAVVNPGEGTTATAIALLHDAHEAARRRCADRCREP